MVYFADCWLGFVVLIMFVCYDFGFAVVWLLVVIWFVLACGVVFGWVCWFCDCCVIG